jgi:TIR domain/Pentapeptide repeats (8 copies)
MDHDEALKLLGGGPEGIAEWNRRRSAGEEIPDLSGADLSAAKLGPLDPIKPNIRGAHLSGADLSGSDLSAANLRWADLAWTDLRRANLAEADLSYATCWNTSFAEVDLSSAKGLETVRHRGPSSIDTHTLIASKGKIPETFLRGCGVPEELICYLPSIIGSMSPIQFYSCFVSYSTKDEDFAKRLHSRLTEEKLRVWYAPDSMRAGSEHDQQIDEAIRLYDKLLLVVSDASMTSGWVRREIRKARQNEGPNKPRKLFPIRLVSIDAIKAWEPIDPRTGEDIAEELLKFHIPDFSNWKDHDAFEVAFTRLLRDLKAEATPTPVT